jgi:hypothetical protein
MENILWQSCHALFISNIVSVASEKLLDFIIFILKPYQEHNHSLTIVRAIFANISVQQEYL